MGVAAVGGKDHLRHGKAVGERHSFDLGGVNSRDQEAQKPKQEWAYVLHNNDWPSEIPGPDLTKREFYALLEKIPGVYEEAIKDLANDPVGVDLPMSPRESNH
ncbi:hypothetical protein [Amycolatopsis japonica]